MDAAYGKDADRDVITRQGRRISAWKAAYGKEAANSEGTQ